MRSLQLQEGAEAQAVFSNLMGGLNAQLDGMGTAFASSLLGLAGSLVVGLLDLFAGHAQNRFYRELEEWLSSITRITIGGDGESSGGATTFAVDLIDRSADQMDMIVKLVKDGEERRAHADAALAGLTETVTRLAERMEADAAAREAAAAAVDNAALVAALEKLAASQADVAAKLEEQLEEGTAEEMSRRLRSIDMALLRVAEEVAAGRQEATAEIRGDLSRIARALGGER
jgi:hypothetical protein